ncbi:hypothetical protein RFI_02848, partial [Reticulomyxa filosa]
EFNSFNILWKDDYTRTHKEPLNPYLTTLKQGVQHFKEKLKQIEHFIKGTDELIHFKYELDNIRLYNDNEDILLHDIYKYVPNYPNIQIFWKIKGHFMVPYKRLINIEKGLLKGPDIEFEQPNEKSKFNPLLYECDVQKLKIMQSILRFKLPQNDQLHNLLHEIIMNGYLCDLITPQTGNKKDEQRLHKYIKKQIHFNKKNPNELILNDKILTILNELKIIYHDDIHKQMGYPLQPWNICAILLYCGKSCNVQFSYDQIKYKHDRWCYLDYYLQEAIMVLHNHEKFEEHETELYCGLKSVRLENIEEIKSGFFISHVSTSDDIEVAKMYRSGQGCILHFHPSMRRSPYIISCDVSWISPFEHEREILFSRSFTCFFFDEKMHKEECGWNAKIEEQDEYTQMILLTWAPHDQYFQQIMQISEKWNHSVDLNLIYVILLSAQEIMTFANVNINEIVHLGLKNFQTWKNRNTEYETKINEFMEHRCCNHDINLLSIWFRDCINYKKEFTAIEFATLNIIHNGLPFIEKDKIKWLENKKK